MRACYRNCSFSPFNTTLEASPFRLGILKNVCLIIRMSAAFTLSQIKRFLIPIRPSGNNLCLDCTFESHDTGIPMKTSILSLCLMAFAFVSSCNTVSAQTLRKDYVVDAPVQYQVTDPWDRGRVFRNHIGHGGFFYNCDNEQCKRDSPFLCFKSENRGKRPSCLQQIRRQLAEAKWRLDAGGCGCPGNYPGCDCEPGICLACNVHPGIPSIDYSKLMPGNATLDSNDTITTPEVTPDTPAPQKSPTIDYYRSGKRRLRKSGSYFAAVPDSIDDGSRSQSETLERKKLPYRSISELPISGGSRTRLHPSILAGSSKKKPRTASSSYRNRLVPVSDAIAAQKRKLQKTTLRSRQQESTTKRVSRSPKRFRLLR